MTLGWKTALVAAMAVSLFLLKLWVKRTPSPKPGRRRWVVEQSAPPRDEPPAP
ncbi:MAG: hypothetical protein IPG45_18430 [Deltaproteobacteria bacterium]|nr:hypothetical protein [Deltaproteobacteria bacterium]